MGLRGTVGRGGEVARRVRDQVLADAQLWADGVDVPADKVPLDAGFHDLPDRLLADFRTNGAKSELARIKAAADRLSGEDAERRRAGDRRICTRGPARPEACCHQYYNEVSGDAPRPARGFTSRGNNVDNDVLLDLQRLLQSRGDQWGLVCISKSGGTLETAAGFRILLHDLKASLGKDAGELAKYVIPVTGKSGKLFDLSSARL